MREKRKTSYTRPRLSLAFLAVVLLAVLSGIAAGRNVYPRVQHLLSSGQTILGQKIAYPAGATANVAAIILTLGPGEETGWHSHATPMFGFIIEGELTVDYGPHGTRVYRTGDALLEAVDLPHNGRNSGQADVRVLAVSMGALGFVDTSPVTKP